MNSATGTLSAQSSSGSSAAVPARAPSHVRPDVAPLPRLARRTWRSLWSRWTGTQQVAQSGRLLGFWPLVASIFFMVSGGPYGLEEVVATHGYSRSVGLFLLVPILWALPIALLIGELGSGLPQEGGYVGWIHRALGPFWSGLSAWLSVVAMCCDMAIYPTMFVTYIGRLFPQFAGTDVLRPGWWLGVAMIAGSVLWNMAGTRRVAMGSMLLAGLLLGPFVLLCMGAAGHLSGAGLAAARATYFAPPLGAGAHGTLAVWVDGVLLCMWNYSGWDSSSLLLGEVRQPQRSYLPALLAAMALIALCYVVPTVAAAVSGLPPAAWGPGSWVDVGRRLCGDTVALLLVCGGAVAGLGMFNALLLANSRLPLLLAQRGVLPALFARRSQGTGTPYVATLSLAALYAVCLGLGFRRLVELAVMLGGFSLALQFASVIALRVREPGLDRTYRVPGPLPVVIGLSLLPMLLLGHSLWARREQPMLIGLSCGELGLLVILLGLPVAAWARRRMLRHDQVLAGREREAAADRA